MKRGTKGFTSLIENSPLAPRKRNMQSNTQKQQQQQQKDKQQQ